MTTHTLDSALAAVKLVYPVQVSDSKSERTEWRGHLILADNLHVHVPLEGKGFPTADAAKAAVDVVFQKEETLLPAGTVYCAGGFVQFVDEETYLLFLRNRKSGTYQKYGYPFYQKTHPKKENLVKRLFQKFSA